MIKKTILSTFIFLGFYITNVNAETTLKDNINSNPISIKISHKFPLNSNNGKSMLKLKELLDAKLGKKIKVDIIEKDPIFEQKKELESLEIGGVDIILVSTERVASYYNNLDYQIFNVPYLFLTHKDLDKFINSETSSKMLTSLNKKTQFIYPISFWPEESKVLLSRNPIKNIKDLTKLKFGYKQNDLTDKYISNLKANPVVLEDSSSFVIKSISGNNNFPIDVLEETTENILYYKYYDYFKNITITNHNYSNYVLIANKKWINSLPIHVKDIIINTVSQVSNSNISLFNDVHEKNIKSLENIPNINIFKLSQEELDDFKKNSILVHDLFLNQYNKNLILEIYQTLKKR